MASIPSWARVGAKVICIDHSINVGRRLFAPFPPKGCPHTVSGVRWDEHDRFWCLLIEGYPNQAVSDPCDRDEGWNVARFRPLVTRTQEQDVALFQPLLTSREVQDA